MSMSAITEDEVMAVIARIELGELRVVPENDWDIAWGGERFKTVDGWTFVVFNDGGQWDYVECVGAPDGRWLESQDISDEKTPRIDGYCPSSAEIARRWGLSERGACVLMRFSR